jgi:trimeric autotransporter adhesin
MRDSGLNHRATEIRSRLGAHPRSRATARASLAGSGLRRASELRLRLGAPIAAPAGGSDAGINAEDRLEIENEIEKIAGRHRIPASGNDFGLVPRKKGILFPLVVNIVAILLTASSVFALSRVFGLKDQEIASTSVKVGSAEGLLLQELKRDSESKLVEKDKAIADIRDRLGSLDEQRKELAGTIDARVAQRELELKASLQAQLDAERRRLGDQGLSEAALQARLKTFEAAKSAESSKLLEAERARAASDKAAAEDSYRKLKAEYQKSMSNLGEERIRLQEESRRREDELRSSMETKNKELESRSSAAEASLAKAKAELSGLVERKARAQAIEDRVIGLYATLRTALRDGRYADAASASASLAAYLEDPSVASDSSTKDRRAADLFVAQTLGAYSRSELARTSADATTLLRQAELLSASRVASAAASAALKSGNSALAAAKYGEALAAVPEILAAHEYFMAREKEAEETKRARLEEALSAAGAAYEAKDVRAASVRYSEALSYLPITPGQRDLVISRLAELGARLAELGAGQAESSRSASETRAARGALASAAKFAASRSWPEAIAGYISLIASFPRADQVPTALSGIEAASSAMRTEAASAVAAAEAAAQKQAKALSALTAEAAARAERDEERAARFEARAASAESRAAALFDELAAAREALDQARAAASGSTTAVSQAAQAASASDAQLRSRIAELESAVRGEAEKASRAASEANAAVAAAAESAQTASASDAQLRARIAELESAVRDEAEKTSRAASDTNAAVATAAQSAQAASASDAQLRSRIAELESALRDEAEKTSRAASAANADISTAALAAKDGEIATLRAEVDRLKGESEKALADAEAKAEGYAAAASKSAAEAASLREIAGKYSALTESYGRYLAQEESSPRGEGAGAAISSQANLYSFLGGPDASSAFPGLRERVSSYQELAQRDALAAFPSDAAEIVRQASLFKDQEALATYYDSRRQAYAAGGNKLMADFISALASSGN